MGRRLAAQCLFVGSLALAMASFAHPSHAQESDWSFMAAPYAWAFGLEGDTGIGDRVASIDESFLDIMDQSDSIVALQGHAEIQYRRVGAFLDGAYADVGYSLDASAERRFFDAEIDADIEEKILLVEAGAFYRVLEEQRLWGDPAAGSDGGLLNADILLGARYTNLDISVDAELTVNQQEFEADFEGDHDWVDPFIGVRTNLRLTEDIDLSLRGDVGGVVTGSDFTWNAQGLLGYRFSLFDAAATAWGGYRALGQDYDDHSGDSEFTWDMVIHGPIIGMSVTW
jgi:hypothetical protein